MTDADMNYLARWSNRFRADPRGGAARRTAAELLRLERQASRLQAELGRVQDAIDAAEDRLADLDAAAPLARAA